MIQFEKFEIQKKGVIKGGVASYSIDLDTGVGTYSYSVTIGALFFTKKISAVDEPFQCDPEILLSSGVQINVPLLYAGLLFVPKGISGLKAAVAVSNRTVFSGDGVLDLSGKCVRIDSVHVKGSYAKIPFEVIAESIKPTYE